MRIVDLSIQGQFPLHKASAGSQPKWYKGGKWYKIDDGNYEGLSETVACDMLRKSNIPEYAVYEPVMFKDKDRMIPGCQSEDFARPGFAHKDSHEILSMYNSEFLKVRYHIPQPDAQELAEFYVAELERITGLATIREYLAKLFLFDQITLNSDRHLANICLFVARDGQYALSPVFDNGRDFALADSLWESGADVPYAVSLVHAKPFSFSFEVQSEIFSKLAGGTTLELRYSESDLEKSLSACAEYYPEEILNRARSVFRFQHRRYRDMFFGEDRDQWGTSLAKAINGMAESPWQCAYETGIVVMHNPNLPDVCIRCFPSGKVVAEHNGSQMDLVRITMSEGGLFSAYSVAKLCSRKLVGDESL